MRFARLLLLGVCVAAASGCGSDKEGEAAADAGQGADAPGPPADAGSGQPQFDLTEGLVQVLERTWPGSGYRQSWATADLYDVVPVRYREVQRVGACRLLEPRPVGFCDPPCDYSHYCSADNQCVPRVDLQSAGEIVLSGLEVEVSLINRGGDYYIPEPAQLPEDLFGAGDAISATAPGKLFAGFTVAAAGVDPTTVALTGEQSEELRLLDGADQTVAWSDADPAARVRLWLPSPNSGHGRPSRAVIECDAADTGSLVISQSLIEAFPEQPRREVCVGHDCPLSSLMRYRSGTTETSSGRVMLRAGAESLFYLVHE